MATVFVVGFWFRFRFWFATGRSEPQRAARSDPPTTILTISKTRFLYYSSHKKTKHINTYSSPLNTHCFLLLSSQSPARVRLPVLPLCKGESGPCKGGGCAQCPHSPAPKEVDQRPEAQPIFIRSKSFPIEIPESIFFAGKSSDILRLQ